MRGGLVDVGGMPCSAAYSTIMLYPAHCQVTTLPSEPSTRSAKEVDVQERAPASGPVLGLYRKPHMSVPMTAGTAYGTKAASRKTRESREVTPSSMQRRDQCQPDHHRGLHQPEHQHPYHARAEHRVVERLG